MQGTLALELAAHAAFGLNLVIVGMGLNDDYLREQVERFRGQIRDIFLFTDRQPESAVGEWVWRNHVRVITAPWEKFWQSVRRELPPPEEIPLRMSWLTALSEAHRSLGGRVSNLIQKLQESFGTRPEQLASWSQVAALQGESGSIKPDACFERLPGIREFLTETFCPVNRDGKSVPET